VIRNFGFLSNHKGESISSLHYVKTQYNKRSRLN